MLICQTTHSLQHWYICARIRGVVCYHFRVNRSFPRVNMLIGQCLHTLDVACINYFQTQGRRITCSRFLLLLLFITVLSPLSCFEFSSPVVRLENNAAIFPSFLTWIPEPWQKPSRYVTPMTIVLTFFPAYPSVLAALFCPGKLSV